MKPIFQYVCHCGFRTNKSWRMKCHVHKPRTRTAKPAPNPLKEAFRLAANKHQ